MKATTEATAVATKPQINGTDVAVHTTIQIGSALHTGFTFLADVSKYATARLVNTIDKSISVQDVDDRISALTDTRLAKARVALSGYKPVPVE